MAAKRKSDGSTSTPSSKRQKTNGSPTPSGTGTPARQPQTLSDQDRSALKQWLDKKASSEKALTFPIAYHASAGKGKKGKAVKAFHEELKLHGRVYGDVSYNVGNAAKWGHLTKYRKCTVGEETFEVGQCVLVKGNEEADSAEEGTDGTLEQWKAQVQEIRALDENHVYLRVTWLCRPSKDLPSGASAYHGPYELVPSTEMAVIDAMTVNGSLDVKLWDEYDDDDVPVAEQYFWRQSYDHIKGALSELRRICKCQEPQNPDRPIVQCHHCQQWMHVKCLEEDALDRAQGQTASYTNGEHPSINVVSPKTKAKQRHIGDKETELDPTNSSPTTRRGTLEAEISLQGTTDSPGKPRVRLRDTKSEQPVETEEEIICLFCQKVVDN